MTEYDRRFNEAIVQLDIARQRLIESQGVREPFTKEVFANYSQDVLDRSIAILSCHEKLPGPLANVLRSLVLAKEVRAERMRAENAAALPNPAQVSARASELRDLIKSVHQTTVTPR